MAAYSDVAMGGDLLRAEAGQKPSLPYALDETYWGYIVRPNVATPMGLVLGQALAWFCGIAFLVATLGLWVLPLSSLSGDVTVMKLGMSVVLMGFAVLLLWFASRGTEAEVQIDMNLGEVREVVRNRAGRPTLLGRYGFDAFGGVFLDRQWSQGRLRAGHAVLVLRHGNTALTLPVANGPESQLLGLRDRLGRDLMVRATARAARKAA